MKQPPFGFAAIGDAVPSDHLTPLFWQRGEAYNVLAGEMRQMRQAGIRSCILEARPFPGFLEQPWWDNLAFLLGEARRLDMKLWVFDDSQFPSGFVAGRIRDRHPQYLKSYIRCDSIDAAGPRSGTSFRIAPWLKTPDERLIAAVACPMEGASGVFDARRAVEVTGRIADGILYFDTPPGRWRIFILIRTRAGGEEYTRDYLNFLDPAPTAAYIREVYEPHFEHFGEDFGGAFAGFFSDEPRFGNIPSYEAPLGSVPMVLPWSDTLLERLSRRCGGDFTTLLPWLWHDGGAATAPARECYMETVTTAYRDNFTLQIGDWCRAHRAGYIGHVIEENGAHCRLGYGVGHYFRSQAGQTMPGCDSVLLQNLPDFRQGLVPTPSGLWRAEFLHYGLAKLASSAGHLLDGMAGNSFVEIFGAYGWSEGLRMMKWMTDHFAVNGVNHFVPHAFSAQPFPDPECPPHFFAGGHNPQWRYFHLWSAYAIRLGKLLSGGLHVAPCAVLYHAEAEWSGRPCDPFERVVSALAVRQVDCDVVPFDLLKDARVGADGQLAVGAETFRALVVPYASWLPEAMLERLEELTSAGLPVVCCGGLPEGCRANSALKVCAYDALADFLDVFDVRCAPAVEHLAVYHYRNEAEDLYFLVNESMIEAVATEIAFPVGRPGFLYDALNDRSVAMTSRLRLAPGESIFAVFPLQPGELPAEPRYSAWREIAALEDRFEVSIATAEDYPVFTPCPAVTAAGDVSRPGLLPNFSGTIRYEQEFDWQAVAGPVFVELDDAHEIAELFLNGESAGVAIIRPYRFEVTRLLRPGFNRLALEITNTLAKAVTNDTFDLGMAHDPSGLAGRIRLTTPIE